MRESARDIERERARGVSESEQARKRASKSERVSETECASD